MREIHLKGYKDWARAGEHNAVALLADASGFLRLWPSGTPQAIFRRPDGAAYPVPCDLAGGAVRILLTSTETAISGMASLEVQWLEDDIVAKNTYSGRINAALQADVAPPDPPGQSWLDRAVGIGAQVEIDRGAIEGARDEVRDAAQAVAADRDAAHGFTERAEAAAEGAEGSEQSAGGSAAQAGQALSDLLSMLGSHVATLGPDGKLTPAQIPPISINDVFQVMDAAQMLALTAERGDVALLMAGDAVADSYILATDDPTDINAWKKLGVSYVANAGHALAADSATDAEKINGKRIISMTQSQYDTAEASGTLDPNTLYIAVPEVGA